MTNLGTNPDGSHYYIAPTPNAGVDRFGAQRPAQEDKTQTPLKKTPVRVAPIKDTPGLYQFEQIFDEFRGGLFKQESGPWSETNGYLLASNAETRFSGYCSNVLKSSAQTVDVPYTSIDYSIQHCEFAGQLVLGVGEFSNDRTYLYKEDPTTGVMTHLNYAKGAGHTITTIAPILFGTTTYLVVGKIKTGTGIFAEALTDIHTTPTSAGAMDGLTEGMYWICNTDREDTAVVALCGTNIVAWTNSQAFNSTPTVMESNVNTGGFLVDVMSLNSSQNRIVYVRPPNGATTTAIQPGSQRGLADFEGQIYWRNMKGQDEQRITGRFGLRRVTAAVSVRGGIAATDRYQATWHNGVETRKLKVFSNAPANSDIQHLIVGFWTDGIELYALINDIPATGVSAGTSGYAMHYDWDTDAWSYVGIGLGFGHPGLTSYEAANGNGLPWSRFTGNLVEAYGPGGGFFFTKFEPYDSSQNPYQLRKTSGTTGDGQSFEVGWQVTTPEYWFDGYEGGEYLVSRVIGPPVSNIQSGGADADDGGALDAYLQADIGGKTFLFSAADPEKEWPHALREGNQEWHATLQLVLQGVNSISDTDAAHYAVQGLPVKVQGFIRMPVPLTVPRDTEAA